LATQQKSKVVRDAKRLFKTSCARKDWSATHKALDILITQGDDIYVATKFGLMVSRMKQPRKGFEFASRMMKESWNDNAWILYQLGWISSGCKTFPIPAEHRNLDFALKAISRATELEASESNLTMLAHILSERGQLSKAAEAQERAIEVLSSRRSKIAPHEMRMYEAELKKLQKKLREYRGSPE
jgi:tetratricopeptide (TPR) repeat protein